LAYSDAELRGKAESLLRGEGAATVAADDDVIHSPSAPWSHNPFYASYDYASVRRGYQVFSQVCATCHSISGLAFRNLVGNGFTEDEVKEIAAEFDVEDGPDETGDMFERPAKLSDIIPGPYKNEAEARYANNGAYPPDLTLICKARHGGADYIFALLTGYRNPPLGVEVAAPMHYNPYFPGGAIGMAQALGDDVVEYEDDTPTTASQYAKDVSTFLAWAAEPEADERKRMGLKFMTLLAGASVAAGWYKRHKWSGLKTRQVTFKQ
jgi:ubiquinol-cytochrome c reductase cytochrome c1 subunit